MKRIILILNSIILSLGGSAAQTKELSMETQVNNNRSFKGQYSDVNGLKMYYETFGQGEPLVLIHGGGSTIETNFERIIPLLAKTRLVIAVELQAHGRTSDRVSELTFEQDADDVATLLKNLNIKKADFLGFSNGGTTTLQIAIRYPELANKIILASALAKRNGAPDWFWDFMKRAKLENMPALLKEGYQNVSPDPMGLQTMHDKDARRMISFKDIPDHQIQSINIPTLIIIGDKDVITPEHALELHRNIKDSELAIVLGGHGEYIGEITTIQPDVKNSYPAIPIIEKFLNKAKKKQTVTDSPPEDSFVISHTFNAEAEKVFQMWVEPEYFAKWLGPAGAKMTFLHAEPKEEGTSFWSMTSSDQQTKYGEIHYKIINPSRLLVYTQNFCDENRNFITAPFSETYPKYLLTTVEFSEEEQRRTKVTVTWKIFGATSAIEQKTFLDLRPVMNSGWMASFHKLDMMLQNE